MQINIGGFNFGEPLTFEFEARLGNQLMQKQTIQGIGAMLYQQWMQLCEQAYNSRQPWYLKMWRMETVHDDFENTNKQIKIGLQYWSYDVEDKDMEEL